MIKKHKSDKPAKAGEEKMADKENKKKPNPTDMHVGSRIRLRRNMLGMSQEKLGESLGITFQQIQKYEKGTNRVGASRLQAIANILGVPVAFFFEDLPGHETAGNRGFAEDPSAAFALDFCTSAGRTSAQPRLRQDHRPKGAAQDHRSGEEPRLRRHRLAARPARGRRRMEKQFPNGPP